MKEKLILCVFKIKKFKDSNKPVHWVGHSKLKSLYIYEFFKISTNFYEEGDSVTGKIEEEKNTAKKTHDAEENAGDNERIHKDKEKVVTIEEEMNTSEYQETMNLDIDKIPSTSQQFWRSLYEVIDD